MFPLATDVSRERVEFLLRSRWPTDVDEVDSWLRNAPEALLMDPPEDGLITPVGINTHEGQISSFYWFAKYPDPAELIEAHDDLSGLVTALLGVSGRQERVPGHAGFWETPQFTIDMYAHDVSERESQGRRELRPTLQVNVADTALAAAKEAIARAAAPKNVLPANHAD